MDLSEKKMFEQQREIEEFPDEEEDQVRQLSDREAKAVFEGLSEGKWNYVGFFKHIFIYEIVDPDESTGTYRIVCRYMHGRPGDIVPLTFKPEGLIEGKSYTWDSLIRTFFSVEVQDAATQRSMWMKNGYLE